jgi:hypothetical protein
MCVGTEENGQRILWIKLKKQKRQTILVLFIKLREYYKTRPIKRYKRKAIGYCGGSIKQMEKFLLSRY